MPLLSTRGGGSARGFGFFGGKGPYDIQVLLLAGGGGGGGGNGGGGGGAGGLLNTATVTVKPGTAYSLSAGGGGAVNTQGSDSTFSGSGTPTLTALKGGRGANNNLGAPTNSAPNIGQGASAGTHGSGGGACRDQHQIGGYGTSGQGNNGLINCPAADPAGGGGGANAAATAGPGGNGLGTYSAILTPVSLPGTVAGGGGGSVYSFAGFEPGGSGGGGRGTARGSPGANGNALTGGGGGGGVVGYSGLWSLPGDAALSGGSGWCVLVIPTASYSGITTGSPTVATSGSNTILSYTGTGTYTA